MVLPSLFIEWIRMIRRDYFVKLVQELSGVLLRIVSLKARQEYAAALHEIDTALDRYLNLGPAQRTPENLDQVLRLCSREEGPAGDSIKMLADVFYEQGEILKLEHDPDAGRGALLLSLGLYLETVQAGIVSLDLLVRIDQLIQQLTDAPLPGPLLGRLCRYLEDRGLYAKAEDVLYEWIERADPKARAEGLAFYERLLLKSGADLARGGLPRAEVEEGKGRLLDRAAS